MPRRQLRREPFRLPRATGRQRRPDPDDKPDYYRGPARLGHRHHPRPALDPSARRPTSGVTPRPPTRPVTPGPTRRPGAPTPLPKVYRISSQSPIGHFSFGPRGASALTTGHQACMLTRTKKQLGHERSRSRAFSVDFKRRQPSQEPGRGPQGVGEVCGRRPRAGPIALHGADPGHRNPGPCAPATTLYAYATGTGTTAGCPRSTSPRTTRVLTAGSDNPGRRGRHDRARHRGRHAPLRRQLGDRTPGTSSGSPVTIEPATGRYRPILDGNDGSATNCTTTSCAGPVLTIGRTNVVYVDITGLAANGLTIENGDNSTPRRPAPGRRRLRYRGPRRRHRQHVGRRPHRGRHVTSTTTRRIRRRHQQRQRRRRGTGTLTVTDSHFHRQPRHHW